MSLGGLIFIIQEIKVALFDAVDLPFIIDLVIEVTG